MSREGIAPPREVAAERRRLPSASRSTFLLFAILPWLGFAQAGPSALPPQTAADYLSFLGEEARASVISGKPLSETGASFDALSFWKGSPFASDALELCASIPATLAADSWTLVRLPPQEDRANEDAATADLPLRIFRAFTAFSTMKGLKTKSAIFRGDEDFMLDSYRVDSELTRRRIPDPEAESVPADAVFTLYGKDFLAGEVYYRLGFVSRAGIFRVSLENLTPMYSLLLKLANPGDLITAFYIIPLGDSLLLYGLTVAKTPLVPGTVGLERKMLANRMIAIGKWFAGNMTKGD
ncbi:MAG: hypothetical protein M0001_14390 [Treponema sp.]|nr:hypothetical protein [Treponema sp.]